jgi:hypothetical protein
LSNKVLASKWAKDVQLAEAVELVEAKKLTRTRKLTKAIHSLNL